MSIIDKIRSYIKENKYRITVHAQQEAAEDDLDKQDIENIIFTGKLIRKLTHDPRGTRYLIRGKSNDGRPVYIVCRFLEIEKLSIITVYIEENKYE